eukprot:scaffold4368_cov139-Skeletonema_marinoi.AAC.1
MNSGIQSSSPASADDDGDTVGSEAYDTLAPLPEDILLRRDESDEIDVDEVDEEALINPSNTGSTAASNNSNSDAPPIDTRRTSHSGRPIFPVRHPTKEDMSQAKKLLTYLQNKHGFVIPDRGNLDDQSVLWKEGRPDYTIADLHYFLGKTTNHPRGSVELFVENFIKTWEMEATHKEFYQWNTVDQCAYEVCSNGGKVFDSQEAPWVGNYNWLLSSCEPDTWDSTKETFESSHGKFRYAFPEGFPFEVLQVFSGPPNVSFTWRHWAVFSGEFEGNQGTGETINMTGFGVVTLNDDLKAKRIDIYFDPTSFLDVLRGKAQCRDGKDRGVAFGDPIAGGLDAVASMMAAIELDDDDEDSDEDGTKVKGISTSGLATDERKGAATGRSGSRCPFSGTSM